MGSKYRQLTEQDRTFIGMMLMKRYPKSKIAKILGVHRSTIYREVKRNSNCYLHRRGYRASYYAAHLAHQKSLDRRKRTLKLLMNKELRAYVHAKLLQGWSPWQIEGRLRLENNGGAMITHETIYRYIYSDYGIRNRFYKKLRRKHFWRLKHQSRKPRVPKELLVNNRPDRINTRSEFGHWECDLMIFKRGIKSNLITLRERKSRYLVAIKNQDKTARGTASRLISTLKSLKPYIHSITFDQGSEFKKYAWVQDCLETEVYFCMPASPHQKGAIENANGVIRSELPRNYDFDALKQSDIVNLIDQINARPLKCLDYRTPKELFSALSGE